MRRLSLALLALAIGGAQAEPAVTRAVEERPAYGGEVGPAPRPEDVIFSGVDPELTAQEEVALGIAERWTAGDPKAIGEPGAGGVIRFKLGVQQPSIVCAVLQVCDIALQKGERIHAINLGDTVRWTVEPAMAGTEDNAVPHVVVKPLDVGLDTSLVVTTDRRVYHLRLRSHRTRYMPQVAFIYSDGTGLWVKPKKKKDGAPGVRGGAGAEAAAIPAAAAPSGPMPAEGEYLGAFDFNYRIVGEAPWKPVRAYNDGKRTFIDLPSAAALARAGSPSLLVVGEGTGKDGAPIDYRVQGDSYIVDAVLNKAVLVAGSGPDQASVTIEREP